MKEVRCRPGPFNEPINMGSQESSAPFSKPINKGPISSFHLVMGMKLSYSKQIQIDSIIIICMLFGWGHLCLFLFGWLWISCDEQKWSLDPGGETKLLGVRETESFYKTAQDKGHSEVNWWILPTGLVVSVPAACAGGLFYIAMYSKGTGTTQSPTQKHYTRNMMTRMTNLKNGEIHWCVKKSSKLYLLWRCKGWSNSL